MPEQSCHTIFFFSTNILSQSSWNTWNISVTSKGTENCSSMLDHSEAFVTGVIHLSCTPMRNSEPGIVSLRKHPSTSSTCLKEIWRGKQRSSALPVMLQVLTALYFYTVGKKFYIMFSDFLCSFSKCPWILSSY